MDFYVVLDQVMDLLRMRGRLTYRALKIQFKLDDDQLEALKSAATCTWTTRRWDKQRTWRPAWSRWPCRARS
jgi:hypothetical protein